MAINHNFPYTNLHDLNVDWILKIIQDFERDYKGINEALDSAIESIIEQGELTSESINELKTLIEAQLENKKQNSITEIGAETTDSINRIENLVQSMPGNSEEMLGQLQIINSILNGTQSEAPTWAQGTYQFNESTQQYEIVNNQYYVTSIMWGGCNGRRIKITSNNTSQKINAIWWWDTNKTIINQAPLGNVQSVEYVFPQTASYFTILLAGATPGTSPISVSATNVTIEWLNTIFDNITHLANAEHSILSSIGGDTPNLVYIEEADASGGALYFKCNGFNVFYNGTSAYIPYTTMMTQLDVSGVVSAKGITNCIEIPNNNALVFDTITKTFKFVLRDAVLPQHTIMMCNAWGRGDHMNPTLVNYKMLKLQRRIDENKVNVKNFGALGDNYTDDGPAIQRAIESIKTTGGTIFIPDGTYILKSNQFNTDVPGIASALMLYNNITLELSPNAVLKRGNSSVTHFIFTYNTNNATMYTGANNIKIKGGTIDCNSSINADCTPINTSHSEHIIIENVKFINARGNWHYIELNSTRHAIIKDCYFGSGGNTEHVQFDSAVNTGNLGSNDGTICQDIDIHNCIFDNGDACGVGNHTDAGHKYIRIHDNIFIGSPESRGCIDTTNSVEKIDIYNNTFRDGNIGVRITHSAQNSTVHDNRFNTIQTPYTGGIAAYNNMINDLLT